MDLVRAFPLLEGKEGALTAFVAELQGPRSAAARDFYGRYGVERESWHLQETPGGRWVICATTLATGQLTERATQYSASDLEFDQWFKDQVRDLTGVDPRTQPLGPPATRLFDSATL